MKYDLSKKVTRGAQRTLDAFSKTMFSLLSEKSFEEIRINELCDISNFPRATFYNYFDDKYDLINYCWYVLSQEIHLDEFTTMNPDDLLTVYFDRIFDLLQKEKNLLNQIIRHNSLTGTLTNSFIYYLKKKMRSIFYRCLKTHKSDVPIELMADHYSNTMLLILEWIFFKQNIITKEEAHHYLDYFLGEL
ncbi:TetR/AcrR family transcriptional regulator [Sporolactobacillus sp. CPB3-1]|uniref:TetR/AcrR family transcriptional regulator n=1 Tax=Sporolactobacillus mangiferae TaxID=2940498 RepID=A0ABT0MD15_9BACL|nr:TetR/AcrR family transcriptional regulator [Sporolactobacillus mangiferae]MCL1632756.1 TetR/AcrR family transcriptional regulator [Sporolactobacillus mangiferae]